MKIWIGTSILIDSQPLRHLRTFENVGFLMNIWSQCLRWGWSLKSYLPKCFSLSIMGFAFPFLLHYIPFKLRLVSAGDVKLFMVIGLLTGLEFVLTCMVIAYVIGGLVALCMMVRNKSLGVRLMAVYFYITNMFLGRKLEKYSHGQGEMLAMPFALMIHFAVLLQVFLFWRSKWIKLLYLKMLNPTY